MVKIVQLTSKLINVARKILLGFVKVKNDPYAMRFIAINVCLTIKMLYMQNEKGSNIFKIMSLFQNKIINFISPISGLLYYDYDYDFFNKWV